MRSSIAIGVGAVVALGCSSKPGSSGSSTSGGGGACGSVTVQGKCSGSILEYCDPGSSQLVEEDCSLLIPDGGEVYNCQEIDAAYGFDCAAPTGQSCVQVGATGEPILGFCQGMGPGCVIGVADALCEVNLPACTNYDADGGFVFPGAPANTVACSGNLLLIYCDESQPAAQDCAAIGGACAALDAGAGACINLPSGQQCDNQQFFCASGLACADPDGGGLGYCGG